MDKQEQGIVETLLSFGLSEKESAVYVAALSLGRATVSAISRKANINRTTGYDILDSLISKGLMSISGKEPKQEYLAESPNQIVEMLEIRLEKTRESIEKAKEFVPTLNSVRKVGNRPEVKFYEGVDGLKRVYEDTLTSSENIRAFASLEDMFETGGDYFPLYFKRRAAKGISIRAIVPRSPMALERSKHDTEEARELAMLPEETFGISPEINIYDDKIMIASWREKLGIIIESAEIASAMKKIYELAWTEAKRIDKTTRLGAESGVGV